MHEIIHRVKSRRSMHIFPKVAARAEDSRSRCAPRWEAEMNSNAAFAQNAEAARAMSCVSLTCFYGRCLSNEFAVRTVRRETRDDCEKVNKIRGVLPKSGDLSRSRWIPAPLSSVFTNWRISCFIGSGRKKVKLGFWRRHVERVTPFVVLEQLNSSLTSM
jgi:hypothetical protein